MTALSWIGSMLLISLLYSDSVEKWTLQIFFLNKITKSGHVLVSMIRNEEIKIKINAMKIIFSLNQRPPRSCFRILLLLIFLKVFRYSDPPWLYFYQLFLESRESFLILFFTLLHSLFKKKRNQYELSIELFRNARTLLLNVKCINVENTTNLFNKKSFIWSNVASLTLYKR